MCVCVCVCARRGPCTYTGQKMKFSIKYFFTKRDQILRKLQTANLASFAEEILNGKFHLCEVLWIYYFIFSLAFRCLSFSVLVAFDKASY